MSDIFAAFYSFQTVSFTPALACCGLCIGAAWMRWSRFLELTFDSLALQSAGAK